MNPMTRIRVFGSVLLKGGKPVAYYNSVAASYGLQAGVQVSATRSSS
jgi:hypothetical protein